MTCLQSQLLSKVTVTSSSFYIKCSTCPPCCCSLNMCCYRSCLVFNCCFEDTDISQGSTVTSLRNGWTFSDSTFTNVLLILS